MFNKFLRKVSLEIQQTPKTSTLVLNGRPLLQATWNHKKTTGGGSIRSATQIDEKVAVALNSAWGNLPARWFIVTEKTSEPAQIATVFTNIQTTVNQSPPLLQKKVSDVTTMKLDIYLNNYFKQSPITTLSEEDRKVIFDKKIMCINDQLLNTVERIQTQNIVHGKIMENVHYDICSQRPLIGGWENARIVTEDENKNNPNAWKDIDKTGINKYFESLKFGYMNTTNVT